MFSFNTQNVICSWKCPNTLYAINEGDSTVFYLENNVEGKVSYHLIKNAVGWLVPEQMPPKVQQIFYSRFKPMLINDNSTALFCLFIKKISGLLVGFLHEKKFCVQFFPEVGLPFIIEIIQDIPLPTYEKAIKFPHDYRFIDELTITVGLEARSLKLSSIKIYIKNLTGSCRGIKVPPYASIGALADQVENVTGFQKDSFRLIFGANQINGQEGSESNARTLRDWKITDGSTIQLLLCLRGGGSDSFSFSHLINEKPKAFVKEAPLGERLLPE